MLQLGLELSPVQGSSGTQSGQSWSIREELLRMSVMIAVPLQIAKLQEKGGPNRWQWEWVRDFADELGSKGDILQFKSDTKGETANVFNNFAYALAIMSFAPGGVRFAGLHFETTVSNGT